MHPPRESSLPATLSGLPTIVSLRGLDRLMGQRSGLSNTDAGTINSMYP